MPKVFGEPSPDGGYQIQTVDGQPPHRASPSRAGMSAGRATRSMQPLAMALAGMESNWAESGSCAKVTPPCEATASSPCVPSEPSPERTTPIARSPSSRASELRKTSIGNRWPCGCDGAATRSVPRRSVSSGGHIHLVRLDRLRIDGLLHRHRRRPLQQFAEQRLVRRIHVLDDDIGQAARHEHVRQGLLQRFKAAGGRRHADDADAGRGGGGQGSASICFFHAQVSVGGVS